MSTYSGRSSLGGMSCGTLGGNLRVYVVLRDETRIIVPMKNFSTVGELRDVAISRAALRGLSYDPSRTELRLEKRDGAIAFPEDSLEDILDDPKGATFYLQSLNSPSRAPPSSSATRQSSSTTAASEVTHIRLITPQLALDHSRLCNIPDIEVRSGITLTALKDLAYGYLYDTPSSSDNHPPPNSTVALFLKSCPLSTTETDTISLQGLGLPGTPSEPLNIFVIPISRESTTTTDSPTKLWGFECSNRGKAALITCLKVLLREVKTVEEFDSFANLLWGVTHFPPAIYAFRKLWDDQSRLSPIAVAVFASCIQALAVKLVPAWATGGGYRTRILEGSRQIIAWIYSLFTQSRPRRASAVAGATPQWIHEVTFRTQTSAASSPSAVTIQVNSRNQPFGGFPVSAMKVARTIQITHHGPFPEPKLLALAMYGSYESKNFYLMFPAGIGATSEQRRNPFIARTSFDRLMSLANDTECLRIIAPAKLSLMISAYPVLTLNKNGFVSIYDLKRRECESPVPQIWNTIDGEETFLQTDPGQYLLQKLQPVIRERENEGTWIVDAWSDQTGVIGQDEPPEEAIVLCVDLSSSMNTKMPPGWVEGSTDSPTRLRLAQDVFKNMVVRSIAYSLPVRMGLVTFSSHSKVKTEEPITSVMYDFKDRIDPLEASGYTALWDSLVKAHDILVEFREKFPNTKLRIVALTDGQDNSSKSIAAVACSKLVTANIVCDSVVFGTDSTTDLFKISRFTGGYAFHPKKVDALNQIFLLETFLDIRMRPESNRPTFTNYSLSQPKAADMRDIMDFPPCKQHPNNGDTFFPISLYSKFLSSAASRRSSSRPSSYASSDASSGYAGSESNSTVSGSVWSGAIQTPSIPLSSASIGSTLMSEIRHMADNVHPDMDVYISETNMGFWKVVMQGPSASPYETGVFVLYVDIGSEFPEKAPAVRFITPVLHPNITKVKYTTYLSLQLALCSLLTYEFYSPFSSMAVSATLYSVLNGHVQRESIPSSAASMVFLSILRYHYPSADSYPATNLYQFMNSAVDPIFTMKLFTDKEASKREVKKYIDKFANETRAAWKNKILGL